jgi:hypothetical protein
MGDGCRTFDLVLFVAKWMQGLRPLKPDLTVEMSREVLVNEWRKDRRADRRSQTLVVQVPGVWSNLCWIQIFLISPARATPISARP